MNKTLPQIILVLTFVFSNSSFALHTASFQGSFDKSKDIENEKKIKELQDIISQADITYKQAEATYKLSEHYMERSDMLSERLHSSINLILILITLSLGFGIFSYVKFVQIGIQRRVTQAVNNVIKRYKAEQDAIIEKFRMEQDDIIKRLVETEKWSVDLRRQAKLVVFNIKGTPIQSDFSKVIMDFKDSTFIDIDSFDTNQILNQINKIPLGELSIVIIEDSDGKLKPDIRVSEKDDINKKMVTLANTLCPMTGLFYYGPGNFPISLVEDRNKSNMVSFANAPAQLYGNLMNLLKFRSITLK